MLRFVILTVLCMGLVAAGASKRKSKHLNKRAAACAENEFQCKNGVCIQEEWTCDSDADCGHGDNSDETLPECPPPGDCSGKHEVKCDNNVCVPLEFRCDGDDDCGDGTDERGCSDFECSGGEWKCDNGLCVEKEWLCDGDNDCTDGSDEMAKNCPDTAMRPGPWK